VRLIRRIGNGSLDINIFDSRLTISDICGFISSCGGVGGCLLGLIYFYTLLDSV
jgi:hypothetical protein